MKINKFNEEEIKKDINLHNQKRIKLTIMATVIKEDGSFLVQNREKSDWPGLTFPGGHVEDNELIAETAVREFEEETGLKLLELENSGYIEWNEFGDDIRHLAILFKSHKFSGSIKSSKEGKVFFIKKSDIEKYALSNDFLKILDKLKI